MMMYLIATADYTGITDNHLSFVKGTKIEYIEKTDNGYIRGKVDGKIGLLPSSHITIDTRPLSVIQQAQAQAQSQAQVQAQQQTQTHTMETTKTDEWSNDTMNELDAPPVNNGTPSLHDDDDNIPIEALAISNMTSPSIESTTTTTTTTATNISGGGGGGAGDNHSPSMLTSMMLERLQSDHRKESGGSGSLEHPCVDSSEVTGVDKKIKKQQSSSSMANTGMGLFHRSKSGSITKHLLPDGSPKRRYANRKRCPRLVVSTFDDLPEDIVADLKQEDIPFEDIKNNFKVFLTVLKFLTRQKITFVHPDDDLLTIEASTEASVAESLVAPAPVVNKPRSKTMEEIQTSSIVIDKEQIVSNNEEEMKKKLLDLKLRRKIRLAGATPEFLASVATTIKEYPDIKKRIKFGNLLGKGGYGKVFEAHYDKKKVAIKVVHYRTPKEQHNVLIEVGFLKRCDHPNIIGYKASVLHVEQLFIIMEYMQGGTLEQAAVTSSHVFKETQIGYIGKEILKGIAYMHQNKLVHRDIKSANVMITVGGEIKLVDFGLCSSVENEVSNHLVGSPFWMPPEMVKGEPHSYPADIWSFGVCMLELMYKKPPHRESRMRAMFTNATKGIDVARLKCSLDLKDMLWQCFEMDPNKRSSAQKLLRHPFFARAETKQGMKGLFDNMFLQRNLNTTGFLH
ncbi:hypothetical protein SAMD00019534_025500, partial [Acytostelium subglobosum LB1]|uniref:hypothetical protein n=1 Tax=Acytostelium subglobosum LB1 TaxID=1410327 RepID=UPI000644BECC